MTPVENAPDATSIAFGDLRLWFNMPSPESRRSVDLFDLKILDLKVFCDSTEWVVAGFARKTVRMGGGTVRSWWGRHRFIEPWFKIIREEPFEYRIDRSSGKIVAEDHNMSTSRACR